jgi:hypothetical protein
VSSTSSTGPSKLTRSRTLVRASRSRACLRIFQPATESSFEATTIGNASILSIVGGRFGRSSRVGGGRTRRV